MAKFLDFAGHGTALGEGEGTHVYEVDYAAWLVTFALGAIVQAQTIESISADLAAIGVHDGDDGAASVDKALHVLTNHRRVGDQVRVGRARLVRGGKARDVNFVTGRPEGARELGVGAGYMPAAVNEDDGGLDSGHGCGVGCGCGE